MLLEVRSSQQVQKRPSPARSHPHTLSEPLWVCPWAPLASGRRQSTPCPSVSPSQPRVAGVQSSRLRANTPGSRSQSGGWPSARPLSSGHLGWCGPAERHREVLRSQTSSSSVLPPPQLLPNTPAAPSPPAPPPSAFLWPQGGDGVEGGSRAREKDGVTPAPGERPGRQGHTALS